MMDNENKQKPAGGPPMTFSMPMYRDFVPLWVRPWIYLVLAFCFQFSNGMYIGALHDIVGEWGVMREDVQMCLYSTLTGMALYFPVLFRMKFRFTNHSLLMTAAAVIVVCNLLTMLRLPMPVVWGLCVVCGMAKIQGTFECMSNIQLWITPKRNFAVFFPVLHIVLLSSIEVAGFLAALFAYHMHWHYMHWFVILLMLLVLVVQAVLTRPVHVMPKIVPLKGLDWFGAVLWCAFWLQTAWVLCYGDWLDWWHSPQLRLVCGTALITLAVCLQRMTHHPNPFYEPAMWGYRYAVPIILLIGVVEALFSCEHALESVFYGAVMHYDNLTSQRLSQWALPGIWVGCLFSLLWLKVLRWNAYKLIAVGLLVFAVYAGGFYFTVDSSISINQLYLPILCRGFAYAVLSIAFMWSLESVMSFQHFFQALSVFNVLHMAIGGLVGAALHAHGLKYYVADGFARCSGYVDAVRASALNVDLGTVASGLGEAFTAQSVKILFGWTLIAALFFAMLMLLWDIPTVRRNIRHIPEWSSVGNGVWRNFKRQQRLHRLRKARRRALSLYGGS